MAGIYIHIPFCRKACHYCDFHFSTSMKTREAVIQAIEQELVSRKSEVNEEIKTIYFGGGTPSILNDTELSNILHRIWANYNVSKHLEITLEVNPEDVNNRALDTWKQQGINRLSIGIQSFDDAILTWMNRNHSGNEAIKSVKKAQEAGFQNISIDLIYGVKHRSLDAWKKELKQALDLNIQHLSAYCLTIEPNTAFAHQASKGEILTLPDEESANEFFTLIDVSAASGINLYEISNLSLAGLESKHNTSYWEGKPYLGIGPGAHSYNGNVRSWNVSNNALYSHEMLSEKRPFEQEILSHSDQYNEYIMTGLRRVKGLDLKEIKSKFNIDLKSEFSSEIQRFNSDNRLVLKSDNLSLTRSGYLLADKIASELFLSS